MLKEPLATQRSVAKCMGVSQRTIQKIIQNRELLSALSELGTSSTRCKVKTISKFVKVNEAVFDWFTRMRDKHGELPITEGIIYHKALQFADALGEKDFK